MTKTITKTFTIEEYQLVLSAIMIAGEALEHDDLDNSPKHKARNHKEAIKMFELFDSMKDS